MLITYDEWFDEIVERHIHKASSQSLGVIFLAV